MTGNGNEPASAFIPDRTDRERSRVSLTPVEDAEASSATSCAASPGRRDEAGAKEEEGRGRRNHQGPEQSACLAIDPIVEIQGVGVAAVAGATPEHQTPQPARGVAGANIDRDRALERAGHRIERIDLAGDEAEVANQQVTAELAESGWGKSDAPGRSELTVGDDSLELSSILIEGIDESLARCGRPLGREPRGRVGHINLAADILNVERYEPHGDVGVGKRAGPEVHRGEVTVEDVDVSFRAVGGIEAGPGVVDGETGVDGAGGRHLDG